MIQLILKRLFTYIPVLLVVVIITFLMVHAAPGGPFDAERVASPEIIEKLNEAYNLDIQAEQSPNLLCQDYQQL